MNFPAVSKTYYLFLLFLSCLRPFHGISSIHAKKADGKTLCIKR